MLKFSATFLLIFVVSTFVNAQTGCIRSALKTRIYTSLQSGTNYRSTTFTDATPGCQYVQTANTCTVSGFSGAAFKGQVGVFTCPIDNYSWVMIILLASMGYFFLSKKKTEVKNVSQLKLILLHKFL
ncbi:hypothetical protein FA048_18540 [Pedobacter polaris]|uniref:IPTL-CTERM sorting domain-containing protein n=1 Tax=Pedobacter polaris TaxID=2571273 RepID=A0A4U1CGT9_9SPHI|nr:hypothetical protein [Pedobacter polaris]TKC05711.1 hypothetical protein FA048_18540 [Pedobacter polaris]